MQTLFITMWVASSVLAQAPIYRWTDARGEVHYTDDLDKVPKGVKVTTTEGVELSVFPNPQPKRAPSPTPIAVTPVVKRAAPPPQSGPVEVRPLRRSVNVEVVPLSKLGGCAFGMAVGTDTMWLRAPKDATLGGRPLPYERVGIHELVHLIEHQTAGQASPTWFAEGFAQYVAADDAEVSIEDVAYWVIHDGGERPLETAFLSLGRVSHLAYGVALEGVRFLVSLVGDEGLRRSLSLREGGMDFAAAMQKVLGFDLAELQRRFAQSLRPKYYERAR